jgi:hypothetical protein
MWSQVLSKNQGRFGKLALGGAAGLFLLKKLGLLHLVPGIGGLLSRGSHGDEEGPLGSSRGHGGGGRRRNLSHDERFMAAYEHADTVYKVSYN